MTGRRTSRPLPGLIGYLAVVFASSWAVALVLGDVTVHPSLPASARLYLSSLVYVATMGWQPLLALWLVRRWIDPGGDCADGFSPVSARVVLASVVAPIALIVAAMLVAYAAGLPIEGSELGSALSRMPGLADAVVLVFAVWTAALLIWLQCVAEELGWRGYSLGRFMRLLGPRLGLAAHGAVWGLWYAPVVLTANRSPDGSLRSAAFVVTCCLLGTLLGWMRLATNSLSPAVIANSVLTLGAGLPLVLHGDDPGVRAAAYGPAGWLPMLACAAVLLGTRLGKAVRLPMRQPTLAGAPDRALSDRRSLH